MVEVGSHLVRGGQGQRRAVEESRVSANAEVKSKVYNFKMFNLQKSFLKILLKTRNSSSSLQAGRRELQGAVTKLSSQGKRLACTQVPPCFLASTTVLHRPSM